MITFCFPLHTLSRISKCESTLELDHVEIKTYVNNRNELIINFDGIFEFTEEEEFDLGELGFNKDHVNNIWCADHPQNDQRMIGMIFIVINKLCCFHFSKG